MSNQPSVYHVLPTLSRNGAEHLAVEMCARLPAHDLRTRLLVLFEEGTLFSDLRERDIRWSLVGERSASRWSLIRSLQRKIYSEPERRPSLIHTHLFGADFWTSLARIVPYRDQSRIPVISTAHNIDRDDSSIRRAARSWAMHRMDHVVAISEDVKRYLIEEIGVHKVRITVIPNGVDLERCVPRSSRPFHDIPRFLIVGRLEPQKGHDTVLKALADVPSSWRLDIVGVGSLERDLKEQAERLGIASRVHFLGERNDVANLMSEADLFLFPSRWEGLGLVLLEATIAGVPCLASDLPAVREVLGDEGLLPPEDPEAWASAIRRTLVASGSAIAAAQRLVPSLKARYDIEVMVKRYADLYRKVMQTHTT